MTIPLDRLYLVPATIAAAAFLYYRKVSLSNDEILLLSSKYGSVLVSVGSAKQI